MKAEKVEDLVIWQKARELYSETSTTLKDRVTDDFLIQHIKRTSISIISNIAEGYDRETNKEFIRFLYIARGSGGEYKSQLYLLLDQKTINAKEFEKLLRIVSEINAKITNLVKYLRQSEVR